MGIDVQALAKAGATKQFSPNYLQGQSYFQFGMQIGLPPLDFVDDASAQFMAQQLGGQVVKLKARTVWCFGEVNNTQIPNVPLQNFIGFANQPGAPDTNALLVVNGGDLAQACTQGVYFMPQELYAEQVLAYLIQGASMSLAAQEYPSQVGSWPKQPVLWYQP